MKLSAKRSPAVLCVALNPAIDQTIEVAGMRVGEVNRAQRAQQDAGGKGVNVASCLADHGVEVVVTGLLGRANAGLFEALFTTKQISNECVYLDGLTRINTKLVDPQKGETTDINLPGPQLPVAGMADCLRDILSVVERNAASLSWLVLSGSLPPGWPADTYATLIQQAHACGIKVMLDTSGPALGAALLAGPDIIKPNRDELGAHLGCRLVTQEETAAAARELLDAQPMLSLIVVSMGHEGALFITRGAVVHAHPLSVRPLSSVGAGDAMVAGIVAAQLEALDLPDGARLATAFAAGKLERLGAHLPEAGRVRELALQVQLDNK